MCQFDDVLRSTLQRTYAVRDIALQLTVNLIVLLKIVYNKTLYSTRARAKTPRHGAGASKEPVMPSYEINYLNSDGSLAAKFETQCAGHKEAQILAHAMKLAGSHQIEVWSERQIIYARKQGAMIVPQSL
jgi:hypothetical protein